MTDEPGYRLLQTADEADRYFTDETLDDTSGRPCRVCVVRGGTEKGEYAP